MPASSTNSAITHVWKTSLRGMRANLIPGIALWILAIIIVAIYYFVPASAPVFDSISDLKIRYGFLYSGIATAIFGGLIPFLYLWISGKIPTSFVRAWALFFIIYWAVRGMEVDALYRFQAYLFGDDSELKTIVTKVFVDQFIYCPFWSAPITAIFYAWKDTGFSWKKLRQKMTASFLMFEVASVLLSIWIVWIPATAIIYSLPLPLQIPLFNLALCFFVLLISMLAKSEETT